MNGVLPGDTERIRLLKAEREVGTIEILVDYAGLSDIARARADIALRSISAALNFRRETLGLRRLDVKASA
jgi:hypothetical protein